MVMVERTRHLDPEDLDRPEWNSLLNNYSKHDIGEAYFVGRVEQMGLTVEHWGIDKRHHDDHLIFDNKMDLRLWEPLDGQDYPPTEPEYGRPIHAEEEMGFEIPQVNTSGEPTEFTTDVTYGQEQWELRALVDVKTKANEDWLGKFNLRHLAHYTEHAAAHSEIGVPTFVYMTMVDPDAETVGRSNIVAPIPTDWNWEELVEHYDHDRHLSYGETKDLARECDLVDRTFRAPDGNLVVEMDEDAYIPFEEFYEIVT